MQIYFKSRTAARQMASKSKAGKVVDNGTQAAFRWGFMLFCRD